MCSCVHARVCACVHARVCVVCVHDCASSLHRLFHVNMFAGLMSYFSLLGFSKGCSSLFYSWFLNAPVMFRESQRDSSK